MLTRITDFDDTGAGTDGTIHNNAWLQLLNDSIDARWSRATSTLTGAQNNLDVDEADLVLLNGASDGAFTGLAAPASPAKPGKITYFVNIHATSVVTFAHQSGSSTAANRFVNTVTSAVTPVSTGGFIAYQYDDSNSRWRQIAYEQGAWIAYTPNLGGSTSESGQAYTTQAGRSRLSGRTVRATGRITLSTLGTITGNVQIEALPYTAQGSFGSTLVIPYFAALTTLVVGLGGYIAPSTATATLQKLTVAAVATSNVAQADLSNTTDIIFSTTYETT